MGIKLKLLLLAFLWIPVAEAISESDAVKLLENADRARGSLKNGIQWDIELKSWEGSEVIERGFRVKSKDEDALSESTSPARNKGETFLFNGTHMWFYKTGLRKPVAISARQKLSGQAANGDIASIHYSKDYQPKVLRNEKVDGQECVVLELKAKSKNVTYDRINYWVSIKSRLGMKAEFLSLEGKPLKVATFEYKNIIKASGKSFPFVSRMDIVDAKNAKNKSSLTYTNPVEANLSSSIFKVNSLVR
jgi:outer membrane lipoprotein-sorting protein